MRRLALAAMLACLPLVSAACNAQPVPPAPPAPPAPAVAPAPGLPPTASLGGPVGIRAGRPLPTPEMRSAALAVRSACAADMARLCANAPPAPPPPGAPAGAPARNGAMRCLMQHTAEASPACSQAITALWTLRRAARG